MTNTRIPAAPGPRFVPSLLELEATRTLAFSDGVWDTASHHRQSRVPDGRVKSAKQRLLRAFGKSPPAREQGIEATL